VVRKKKAKNGQNIFPFFSAALGPRQSVEMFSVILCKTPCFGWVTELSTIFATNVTSRCLLWASFGLKIFSIYHSTWRDVHTIKQVVCYPSAMFSALKKWAKGGNEDSKISTPLGVQAMGQALQRKFARGVQYNSKFFGNLWTEHLRFLNDNFLKKIYTLRITTLP